ncbi:iron uptake porin [Synechocystis sp. PCC 7509]|uniref:iron uptake porin n=1 Tax=Synechocystis sp. PCC 7509 TaxID=927677 RepID=UPI0002ACF43A|nr:iron uptake porin [Synechocystis sp. PCC 7509]
MSKIFWQALLLYPAVIGAIVAIAPVAMATEEIKTTKAQLPVVVAEKELKIAQTSVEAQPQEAIAPVDTLRAIDTYSNEGKGNSNSIAQVTSVSQLSDVQPTDWAFQALQSLVERYGCIAGYPDGTYRGNRATTRYEFAAGLNACLDRVNELIATATADAVRREDLATLQRLQEEFATELATLRGRVDSLEVVTAELEANQFSTTTKLLGEVVAAVSDTFGDNVDAENNTVLQARARLEFQSSFNGTDILHTRLAAGNAQTFNTGGTFEGQQTFNLAPSTDNSVFLDWAAYEFTIFEKARVYLAAVGGIYTDFVPTLNPYFENFTGGNGALSTFAERNPIYNIGGGGGGGINIPFGERGVLGATSISLGYFADNANSPDDSLGLIEGDFSALGQINFNLGDRFGIAATYVRGYHNAGDGIFDLGSSASRAIGAPIEGSAQANDPSSLLSGATRLNTDSYGLSAALRLSDRISISGWVTKTDIEIADLGSADVWSYALGVAFPDLGKEGNVLGIIAGVEPTLRSLDTPGVARRSFDPNYGYHIEGFYKYQLTDNISLTPGVIWLTAPGQSANREDIVIGTLRTTFTF